MTYFRKKFSPQKGHFSNFGTQTPIREETAKNIENYLFKKNENYSDPKQYDAYKFSYKKSKSLNPTVHAVTSC